MFTNQLIILSYHQFVEKESAYPFSRTFEQFRHDIDKKTYDWITIDDARACSVRACNMLRERNVRAKIFVNISLVGRQGYCNWADIAKLSKYHHIENHSYLHSHHDKLGAKEIYQSISAANFEIKKHVGRAPRYFVAPYNTYDERVDKIARELNLIALKDRITIKNNTK